MRRILVALVPVVIVASLSLGPAHAQAPGWKMQLALPSGNLFAATFASPDVVWAAGTGGIFRSTDAGHSWSLVYNSPQPVSAIAAAPDGAHGWAVGAAGLIVATTDGGATWQQQVSGTQVNLATVAAVGNAAAIAAGVGSGFGDVVMEPQPHVILRTNDGGKTWNELRFDAGYRTRVIDFLADGKHGWMAADQCVPPASPSGAMGCDPSAGRTLLKSDDGGASWTPVAHDVSPYQMQFVSKSAGWAMGCLDMNCAGGLLRTTDGGATWQQVRASGPSALWAFDAQHAIVAERRCANECVTQIIETVDGGATWHEMGLPTRDYVTVVQFSSGEAGVSFVFGGRARWTANAGSAWQDARFPVVVGSGAIDFVDGARGWLAASELLRTEDGGSTWTSVSANAFAEIDFVSLTEGWATRSVCSGVCETAVFHTTDGGVTWRQQFTTSGPNVPRLVFTTESDGWMLFESDGRALHTRDGGMTWYEQALPTKPARFGNAGRAVFVDGSAGWVAVADCAPGWSDCRGQVYRTVDGGDSWAPVSDFMTGGCYLSDVAATDARHVWVEGAGCLGDSWTMYRSENAGNSWSAAPLATPLNDVTFFDDATGRALGRVCDQSRCVSMLVRTSDGGAMWAPDASTVDAYATRARFASPEHAWVVLDRGGGVTSVFSQTVFAYAGVEPAMPALRQITVPDTGAGSEVGRHYGVLYAALLAAWGAALIAAGGLLRRISGQHRGP